MGRVKIEKRRRGNPGLPHGESIYKSQYCQHVIEMLFHPAGLSYKEIVRRLRKQYGFKTTPATLTHFKQNYLEGGKYFNPKDIEEIKKKADATRTTLISQKEALIEHTTNSIEYLQSLIIELEDRTVKLKKAQADAEKKEKFVGTYERSINNNIELIASLQERISKITGGQDLHELKLNVIKDVMTIAAEVFVVHIPADKRDKLVAQFKSRIKEYGEGHRK